MFPLVLISPLQVCSKGLSIVNIVLIPPLQSPWSSVTQGPLTLWVLTGLAIHKASTTPDLIVGSVDDFIFN